MSDAALSAAKTAGTDAAAMDASGDGDAGGIHSSVNGLHGDGLQGIGVKSMMSLIDGT